MKRDMDLVRQLLFHLEEKTDLRVRQDIAVEGYSRETVSYHLMLLAQAGLIDFEASRSSTSPERLIAVYPFNLTWQGHEFLSKARNDVFWNRAKDKLAAIGGGMSISLLQALLEHYTKQAIGLDV